EDLIVWFNRRIDPVLARLPEGYWTVGLVSDDQAVLPVADRAATLPPRSVVVLLKGQIPPAKPEVPVPPQEIPVQPDTPQPPPQPDNVPGVPPEELPDDEPPEETPKE
ncbi:MAG TPA: hypothetical protein VGE95_11360, partial [Arthrobacter sp.]